MADAQLALFAALATKMTGNATLVAALPGGIHNGQSRTSTGALPVTYPYLVMQGVSGVPDYDYTSEFAEELVQFTIFDRANTVDATLAVVGALHNLLDDTTLTVSGWFFLSMFRESCIPLPADEENVRQYTSTYRIKLQNSA